MVLESICNLNLWGYLDKKTSRNDGMTNDDAIIIFNG